MTILDGGIRKITVLIPEINGGFSTGAGTGLNRMVIWLRDGKKLTSLGFILIPTAVWLITDGIR